VNFPYLKYIFPSTAYEHNPSSLIANTHDTLPPGYRYSDLRHPHDLQLAIHRTHIPRTVETLALLPSRAIFFDEGPAPVAWGFLGLDASLTTLHTETAHRGRGLAVRLARELLRMQGKEFKPRAYEPRGGFNADSGSRWGHADVVEQNIGSRKVMERAGGAVMWKDCVVEIELEKLFGKGGLWVDVETGADVPEEQKGPAR
jgi:hypothetical protein